TTARSGAGASEVGAAPGPALDAPPPSLAATAAPTPATTTSAAAASGTHRFTVIPIRLLPHHDAPGGGPGGDSEPTKAGAVEVVEGGHYRLPGRARSSRRRVNISRRILTMTVGDERVETPLVRGK